MHGDANSRTARKASVAHLSDSALSAEIGRLESMQDGVVALLGADIGGASRASFQEIERPLAELRTERLSRIEENGQEAERLIELDGVLATLRTEIAVKEQRLKGLGMTAGRAAKDAGKAWIHLLVSRQSYYQAEYERLERRALVLEVLALGERRGWQEFCVYEPDPETDITRPGPVLGPGPESWQRAVFDLTIEQLKLARDQLLQPQQNAPRSARPERPPARRGRRRLKDDPRILADVKNVDDMCAREKGVSKRSACQRVGIPEDTYYKAVKQLKDQGHYPLL